MRTNSAALIEDPEPKSNDSPCIITRTGDDGKSFLALIECSSGGPLVVVDAAASGIFKWAWQNRNIVSGESTVTLHLHFTRRKFT